MNMMHKFWITAAKIKAAGVTLKAALVDTPKSWCCCDCGINTAPHHPNRADIKKAFTRSGRRIKAAIDDKSEVYSVHGAVWKAAGMKPHGGCLCIGCLEKRIGRKLKPRDFSSWHAFNSPEMPCTDRLRERRGG
jgi:hypothetical protein